MSLVRRTMFGLLYLSIGRSVGEVSQEIAAALTQHLLGTGRRGAALEAGIIAARAHPDDGGRT